MKRNKLRSRQKTLMSTKMRLVVGASVFLAASLLLIIVFNFGEVKDSRAFSSGDYRSAADGDWSDASLWEVFDGEGWSNASMPPGPGVKNVLITGNSNMTITDEIVISNLIIDEGSSLTLDANSMRISKMNGKGELLCNGTLSLGTSIIEGDADVVIGRNAILMIGSDADIDKKGASGNLQLSGKKDFSKDAIYVFNGSVKQHTGNGLPAVLSFLEVDNPSGIELDQSLLIINKLTLSNGNVCTGRFTLAIGSSNTNPAVIERKSGAVIGKLKRWYGASNYKDVCFPVSDGQSVCIFSFTADVPVYQMGLIELVYHDGLPDDSKISPFEIRHVVVGITQNGYYTAFLSNGPDEAWLKTGATITDKSNENKISWIITKNNSAESGKTENKNLASDRITKSENIQNILCGPNPFKDQFYIRFFSEYKAVANLQIMNEGGQLVYSDTINTEPGNNQFRYANEKPLPPGVYVLRISNSSEIHTIKLVKES